MTDDEIARHNEIARAQREAAWNATVYMSPWFCRHAGNRAFEAQQERARIARQYPLKRRVQRVETAPVRTRLFADPCEISYRITDGVVFYERPREGWQQWLSVDKARTKWRDEISRHEDDIRQIKRLLAMCDAADEAVEDDTEWHDA